MQLRTPVAEELVRADHDLWVEWMSAVRAIRENPFGVDVVHEGDLTMLHVHGMPKPYYNRILGLGEHNLVLLDGSLAFYSERMTPCRIDVLPVASGPRLLGALNDRGMRPVEFQTNLWARIADLQVRDPAPGVAVRPIRPDELTFFCRLYERAYYGSRSPRRLARFRAASIRARATRPGWRFYLASVDGVPAGGGALFIKDGVATLAGGATIFTMRGRGCQKALLGRRIADASEAGARIVASRCVAGSVSQRNMERVGLRVAYTKSIWQHPEDRSFPARGKGPAKI